MSVRIIIEAYQFLWSLEANDQQRLAWQDAADARIARARAEAQASAQLQAMLTANPTGSLGHAHLNDQDTLEESGLL